MKSAIVYYSYTGNTGKVAETLKKHLSQKGVVDMIELKPQDESGNFLGQCKRAFRHERALLKETNFNLSGYDLICVGTPVWAFGPTPAVNTFIDNCQGTAGKEVILFTTYGSGTGNQKALDYMQGLLAKNGVRSFKQFSIQQGKVRNEAAVLAKIGSIL